MINIVILKGNLTRDPELKDLTNHKVCHFSIAVNDGNGDKEKTYFFNCTAWDARADYATKWLHKGDSVTVRGRLTTRQYQKPGASDPTTYTEIVVDEILDSYHRRDQSQQPQDDYVPPEPTTASVTKPAAITTPAPAVMPNRPQPNSAPSKEEPTSAPVTESDVMDVVDDDLPF